MTFIDTIVVCVIAGLPFWSGFCTVAVVTQSDTSIKYNDDNYYNIQNAYIYLQVVYTGYVQYTIHYCINYGVP